MQVMGVRVTGLQKKGVTGAGDVGGKGLLVTG